MSDTISTLNAKATPDLARFDRPSGVFPMDRPVNSIQNEHRINGAERTSLPPLHGLRVVELARVLAGPWIGQTLADLGAEVIKIESSQGDDTRSWGPPFIDRPDGHGGSERSAAYFHSANRGKQSVTCDFADPDDLARVKQLIAEADVVVENFKLGGLRKFGLDYESVAAINPRLVYASVTGFGQTGPMAALPGYDFLIQGMCGIMDLTGEPEGEPQKVGVALDRRLHRALWCDRDPSGSCRADTVGPGPACRPCASRLRGGRPGEPGDELPRLRRGARRIGNANPNIVPYQVFPASDGHVIITCGNDRQFAALCRVLGLEELAVDPAYATNPARVSNRTELCRIIAQQTVTQMKGALISALERAGVPAGPIKTVAEALEEPQIGPVACASRRRASPDFAPRSAFRGAPSFSTPPRRCWGAELGSLHPSQFGWATRRDDPGRRRDRRRPDGEWYRACLFAGWV